MEAIGRWVRSRETADSLFRFLPRSAAFCQVLPLQPVSRFGALPWPAAYCRGMQPHPIK